MFGSTDVAPASDDEFRWARVIALFAPHRRRVFGVVLLVLLVAALGVVNPLLLRRVFDSGLFPEDGNLDLGLVTGLSLTMLAVTTTSGLLGVWRTVATNRLGQDVLRDLRNRLYQHLQGLSLSFYSGARTGDLQSGITNDVGGIQNAVTSTLSNVLANAVTFVSALVAMLFLSVPLTGLAVVTVPLFVIATRWVGSQRERFTAEKQVATAQMSVVTQETLSISGITLAKLFGRQDREIGRFEQANEDLAKAATSQQVIGQAFFTVVQTFMGATPILVYLVAGFLLDRGTSITAGTIVAFTTLQTQLFFPVARLLETSVELQSSRALFRRIFGYLDAEADVVEVEDAIYLSPEEVAGRVAFDDVHFAYDGADETLEDLTFTARPGTLVAFVGASGSGKSTILNLVARLYDPTSGSISIDGVDLRQLSFQSLAETVGFVTQESYLFAGTLRENICYGQPNASDAEVEKAARAASIHERIMEFEDGYETTVGERGFRLSGGERQRVAIARVLLHDPQVLVLDEATSALDTASERRIQAALDELVSGRTTLAVAHRLSTIQAADVIHVVDHGRIVESGDHNELLAVKGAYAELYREQFGEGTIETTCSDGVVYSDGRYSFAAPNEI